MAMQNRQQEGEAVTLDTHGEAPGMAALPIVHQGLDFHQ